MFHLSSTIAIMPRDGLTREQGVITENSTGWSFNVGFAPPCRQRFWS
jgi:hypothetical protein